MDRMGRMGRINKRQVLKEWSHTDGLFFGVRVTWHRFVRCRPGDILHSLEIQ